MARQVITASELRALLERDFYERRVAECASACRVPMPLFRAPTNEGVHNWYIGTPLHCPRYCHKMITLAVERLAAEYDIEAPQAP
jgi:hypothetical protein